MRLLLLALAACSHTQADPKATGPIVLELFTSEGCSSCPPADKLLAKLATDATLAPLSFHVDYWDDLGWADPFAKPAWTERQHAYAKSLGENRVYTPELVVGGRKGMVGSNAVAVQTALANTPRPALLAAKSAWSARKLDVSVTAPADADVFVAVYEERATTKVPRGENAGETLAHARVVRRFERVAIAGKSGSITVAIDPAWKTVGAIAFAQRADRAISASTFLR